MKNLFILLSFLILFQSCFTYKTVNYDEILNDKDASNSTIEEYMYRYAGDLFNTALVGAGMFKDLAGTFLEPEYRVVQDTGSIDLMEYMFKRATRSLPDKFEPERGEVPLYNPARNKPNPA